MANMNMQDMYDALPNVEWYSKAFLGANFKEAVIARDNNGWLFFHIIVNEPVGDMKLPHFERTRAVYSTGEPEVRLTFPVYDPADLMKLVDPVQRAAREAQATEMLLQSEATLDAESQRAEDTRASVHAMLMAAELKMG